MEGEMNWVQLIHANASMFWDHVEISEHYQPGKIHLIVNFPPPPSLALPLLLVPAGGLGAKQIDRRPQAV